MDLLIKYSTSLLEGLQKTEIDMKWLTYYRANLGITSMGYDITFQPEE